MLSCLLACSQETVNTWCLVHAALAGTTGLLFTPSAVGVTFSRVALTDACVYLGSSAARVAGQAGVGIELPGWGSNGNSNDSSTVTAAGESEGLGGAGDGESLLTSERTAADDTVDNKPLRLVAPFDVVFTDSPSRSSEEDSAGRLPLGTWTVDHITEQFNARLTPSVIAASGKDLQVLLEALLPVQRACAKAVVDLQQARPSPKSTRPRRKRKWRLPFNSGASSRTHSAAAAEAGSGEGSVAEASSATGYMVEVEEVAVRFQLFADNPDCSRTPVSFA